MLSHQSDCLRGIITTDHCMSTGSSFPSESVQNLFFDEAAVHTQKKKQGLGTRLLVELFLYHTLELGKYQLSLSWYLHYQ